MSKTHEPTTRTSPDLERLVHSTKDLVAGTSEKLGHRCRLTEQKQIVLTRRLADEILGFPRCEYERTLDSQHVANLQKLMAHGLFAGELTNLAAAYCVALKIWLRLNGQHTCWAVKLWPKDMPFPRIVVNLLKYRCDTEDDVRIQWNKFDRIKIRTPGNVINAILHNQVGFEDCSTRTKKALTDGLAFWKWETPHEQNKHGPEERAVLVLTDERKLAVAVLNILRAIPRTPVTQHVWRAPTFAAMYETCQASMSDSLDFWKAIGEGTGMGKKGDPKLTLMHYLQQNQLKGASTSHRLGELTEREMMYRGCIMAWNAWRESRDLYVLKPSTTIRRPRAK